MSGSGELQASVAKFMASEGGISRVRAARDGGCESEMFRALWQKFTHMGLPGMLIAPEHGGLGMTAPDACMVMKEIGKHLTHSPFFSTSVVAAHVLQRHGSSDQKSMFLPRIAQGDLLFALALSEGIKFDAQDIATSATLEDGAWRIRGEKRAVCDGAMADWLIVTAKTSHPGGTGLTLFAVQASAPGIRRHVVKTADHRSVASFVFEDVAVDASAVIGQAHLATDVLPEMLRLISVSSAAELVGIATEAFRMTLDYVLQRVQFGVPIGRFQALQHRMARMHIDLEMANAAIDRASMAVANDSQQASLYAAVCKAKCAAMSSHAVKEAIQMHGGIGLTDEYPLGFYMKRQRTLSEAFGDERYCLNWLATLNGY